MAARRPLGAISLEVEEASGVELLDNLSQMQKIHQEPISNEGPCPYVNVISSLQQRT